VRAAHLGSWTRLRGEGPRRRAPSLKAPPAHTWQVVHGGSKVACSVGVQACARVNTRQLRAWPTSSLTSAHCCVPLSRSAVVHLQAGGHHCAVCQQPAVALPCTNANGAALAHRACMAHLGVHTPP